MYFFNVLVAQFDGLHFLFNNYTHEPNFAFLRGYTTLVGGILNKLGDNYDQTVIILLIINKILLLCALIELK